MFNRIGPRLICPMELFWGRVFGNFRLGFQFKSTKFVSAFLGGDDDGNDVDVDDIDGVNDGDD